MKVSKQQTAPNFIVLDINGDTINLSDYKGKKVLLTFFRNVGCPICNFRFHELEKDSSYFKSKGVVLLAVYESSPENMKSYLQGASFHSIMIPNPDLSLYKLYDIERSMGKVMKGMLNGAMHKMRQGKKLFRKEMKQDGNMNRIGADFLIDEQGKIQMAYYGKYIGDHLSMDELKKLVK